MADGITLARAFVEIIPTVQGMQGNIGQALAPVEKEADASGKRSGGKFLAGFGAVAGGTALAVGAVGASVGVVGKQLYDVGSIFDDVSDTIRVQTGASGEALAGLEGVAKNVGKNVPASFEQIAPVVSDLNTRLGLSGDTLDTVAQQYLNAGNILGQDVDIQSTTAAFSAFHIEGDQVVGAMDTLFQVSQATGVGMNELAASVQKNAPAMQNLGFSFEETAQMAGALDKAGLNSTQIMTSMSKGLVTLAKDGEEPAAAFDRVTGEIQRMTDAGDIAGATDLAGKVFGTKGATQFVGALQSGKVNMDDLKASVGATGDTINGLAKETADLPEQWEMFKNTALTAIEPVGTAVFGLAGEAMGKLTDGIRTVSDSFEGIKTVFATGDFDPSKWGEGVREDSPLVGFVFALRDGFEAVKPVLLAVRDAFSSLDWAGISAGLRPFVDGVMLLAPALLDAWTNLSPLSLIFKALAPSLPMLGEAFATLAGTLGGVLTTVLSALLPAVADIVGALGPVLSTVISALIPIILQVVQTLAPLITMFADMLAPILVLVAGLVSDLLVALLPLISALLGMVSDILGPLLGAIMAVLTPLMDLLTAILTPLVSLISAVLVPVVNVLAAVLSVVADVIGAVLNVALSVLSGAITWLVGVVSAAIPAIVEWFTGTLVPALTAAWNGIAAGAMWLWTNVISPVWTGIQTAIAVAVAVIMTIIDGLVWLWQNVLAPVAMWLYTNVIQPVWNGIQTAIGVVVSVVTGYINAWIWLFQNVLAPVFTWLWTNVISPVWNGIKLAISAVVDWFQGTAWPIIQTVIGLVRTGFEVMRDRIGDAWAWIKDRIIDPVVSWFRDTIKPVFDDVTSKIGASFDGLKDTIGKAWTAIQDVAKVPIDFVVNKVYNAGLKDNFNKVAEKMGISTRLPTMYLPDGFRTGGILPGQSRMADGDDQLVPMRRGEGVLVSEGLRDAASRSLFLAANAAARTGTSFASFVHQGYAGGGIIGDIWEGLKDVGGDAIDMVQKGWDFMSDALTDPAGAFTKLTDGLLAKIPGGAFADFAKEVPRKIASGIGDALGGVFASTDAGAVPATNTGARTFPNWQAQYNALRGVASGYGLVMTSNFRGGAKTAGGGYTSLHALGRAVDWSGPASGMSAFFDYLKANTSPTELLYSPKGAGQKNRSSGWHDTSGATKKNHYSHVHAGFAGGGILDTYLHDGGGWHDPGTLSLNMLREPEAVLPKQQFDDMHELASRAVDAPASVMNVTVENRPGEDPTTTGRRIGEAAQMARRVGVGG